MPNFPQQETIVQYTTNSAQTAYTFAFYSPTSGDIDVYYQASDATPIPESDILILDTDYTVTFDSDPIDGGTITLLFTPTTGYYLTINRNVKATFNYSFAAAQTLSGQTLDSAFDRLFLLIQQNTNYNLVRNLSYIINTYLPDASPYTQLPPLDENYIWIGSGAGITSALVDQVPSASVLQSLLADAAPSTDGARIVGYYDVNNSVASTVDAVLKTLQAASLFVIPSGTILDFAGTSVPTGFLPCDGAAVSRTTYATLFSAIGTTWGVGNGTTTFNVPDLARRVTLGSGGSATSPVFSGTTVGSTGGEEIHTMTTSELVAHTHNTFSSGAGAFSENQPAGGRGSPNDAGTSSATGSTTPFNVMQLGAVVTKMIKT